MKIKFNNGTVVKKRSSNRKIRKDEVIRALSTMEEEKNKPQQPTANTTNSATTTNNGTGNPDEFQDEFYNSGRIGRRNAMPDILGNGSQTSTADLPLKLSALTTSEATSTAPKNNEASSQNATNK